jgi:hypothetical protein
MDWLKWAKQFNVSILQRRWIFGIMNFDENLVKKSKMGEISRTYIPARPSLNIEQKDRRKRNY